mgnify:CR=1 FL=1
MNAMSLVIKTATSTIRVGYEGEYPDGAVTYTGTLNGIPVSRSIPTEWNPPSSRPTNVEAQFNLLVEESGAVPHLLVEKNGTFKINFTGEGYPVELNPRWLPSEVRDKFRESFIGAIPPEAEAERSAILAAEAERKQAIEQWLRENPGSEEWEYGLD